MAFTLSPQDVTNASATDWNQWKLMFPGVEDPGEMWHMLYYATDPKTFFASVIGHWNTLDDTGKLAYANLIASWLKKNQSSQQLMDSLLQADTGILMPMATHILPDFGEWANSVFIKRDENEYISASVRLNAMLYGDNKKTHALKFIEYMQKYAAPGWQSKVPVSLLETAGQEAIKELQVQSASISPDLEPGAGKLIAALLIGGFGIWGVSRLLSRKK